MNKFKINSKFSRFFMILNFGTFMNIQLLKLSINPSWNKSIMFKHKKAPKSSHEKSCWITRRTTKCTAHQEPGSPDCRTFLLPGLSWTVLGSQIRNLIFEGSFNSSPFSLLIDTGAEVDFFLRFYPRGALLFTSYSLNRKRWNLKWEVWLKS